MSEKIPSAHPEINIIESLTSRYENGEITALEMSVEIVCLNINDTELRNLVESLTREVTARLLNELGQNNPVFGRIWNIFSNERRISNGQIEHDTEYKDGEIFETELQDSNRQLSAWRSSTLSKAKPRNEGLKEEEEEEEEENDEN